MPDMSKILAAQGAAIAMAKDNEGRKVADARMRGERAGIEAARDRGERAGIEAARDRGEQAKAEMALEAWRESSSNPYKPKPLGRDDVMGPPAQDNGIEWTDPDGKMKYKLLPSGDIDIVVGVNGDKGPVLKKGSPAYQKYAGAILATFKGPAPLPEGKGDMPMAQAGAAGGEMLKGASREAPSYDFGGPTRR